MAEIVRVDAPAKINLRLCILDREASGYHGLETLFCAVSLHDSVRVELGEPGVRLQVDGDIDVGPPEQNLCVRAAIAFFGRASLEPAVTIRLRKRIPAAAGLGGGSSDAAATLRALNHLHGEPLDGATLLKLAGDLGSDVPFFVAGSAFALAWSRGERLLTLPPLPPRPLLVVHPGVAMPTPEAFRTVAAGRDAAYRSPAHTIDLAALSTWGGVAGLAANDFRDGAIARVPELAAAEREMRAHGAEIVLLSGSGASLFGVFATGEERDSAARAFEGTGFRSWSATTLERLPSPRSASP